MQHTDPAAVFERSTQGLTALDAWIERDGQTWILVIDDWGDVEWGIEEWPGFGDSDIARSAVVYVYHWSESNSSSHPEHHVVDLAGAEDISDDYGATLVAAYIAHCKEQFYE